MYTRRYYNEYEAYDQDLRKYNDKYYYGERTESFDKEDYIYMKEQLEKGHFIKL